MRAFFTRLARAATLGNIASWISALAARSNELARRALLCIPLLPAAFLQEGARETVLETARGFGFEAHSPQAGCSPK